MGVIQQIIDMVSRLFLWWVIVEPWETGIRVRLGKRIKQMPPGIYFRIPFFDACYVQEARMRMVSMNPQTVTSKDGQTITISSSVGYSIKDITKLFQSISHPDTTIINTVLACIAQYVATHNCKEFSPQELEQTVQASLTQIEYGVKFEQVRITNYAVVKTYRLIMDSTWQANTIQLETKR